MAEQWRDVVGYEGFYQVSDLGRVRSVDRVVKHNLGGPKKLIGRILQSSPNSVSVHLKVKLCKGGVQTNKHVHRIVLEAWVGPCPDGKEGCHGRGGPTDNSVGNLRWDTHQNNVLDMYKDGNGHNRRVRRSDGVEFDSIVEAADKTGCLRQNIWAVCNGRYKTAGGYGWEYLT